MNTTRKKSRFDNDLSLTMMTATTVDCETTNLDRLYSLSVCL
jgi:hypothetical protein